MSILTYRELKQLVEQNVMTNVHPDQINAASIDVTLGSTLYLEQAPRGGFDRVDLIAKEVPLLQPVTIHGYYDLAPGQFCLGATQEVFNLPNDLVAEVKLRSSVARAGLDHSLAGWADPGFNGSVLTLELFNNLKYHWLRLRPGMKIAQVIFMRGEAVPDYASYSTRGRYNKDMSATPSKGV